MASPPSQPSSRIFALPSELLEETLVITAAGGFPSAIAAFGRTCRYFHRLVYRSPDHHLWRQVFLTIFDDPRPVLKRLRDATLTGPTGNKSCDSDVAVDWPGEFMRRMDAARLFRKHAEYMPTDIDVFSSTQEIDDIPFTLTKALETIISVLETSAPFPSHDATERSTKFPQLILLHAARSFPCEYRSLNSAWIEKILEYGYPPALVKRYILAGHQPSRPKPLKATEDTVWGYPEEGRLFHKLVFLKGFIPVPTTPSSVVEPWEASRDSEHLPRKSLQSAEKQTLAAREVARSKVYNLRYLRPERSWGPFLPLGGETREFGGKSKAPAPTFPDFEQELSRYMLNVGNLIVDEASSTSDSYDDPDFIPDEDDDDDEEEEEVEDVGVMFGRRRIDPKFVGPEPHEVSPDYTWLAAARLLVETNLRELLMIDALDQTGDPEAVDREVFRVADALSCLEFTRMGGAPGFWENSWVPPPAAAKDGGDVTMASPDRKGKGKATVVGQEELEGWDWAGAAGRWIRVICWLDYRDLLLHNLHGYTGDDLGETIRFFPMTLRVAGYSKPPIPDPSEPIREVDSLMWKLPVIHVEGESRGSDLEHDSQIVRKVKGTVRMIRDGVVRWSMTSSYPDEDVPEWATEGIQIGSVGSAVGILGMWTGAEHASTDPLGPAWAWKIA
ncbi:hypothetical protein LshimejAT787_1205100 [Lyophyllum shimeji]|uniref:F-box domain-containing protein n=1 Tax=Lyophyllum shimeji TaxID=47721 RepID=A0A9P3UUD4_LYOSH|nr:hypothetical protein LshimejAT787_1205100 [Lyophyllum shimeji]